MHQSQADFVRLLSENFSEYFKNNRVLEVGSLDINGSIRGFFHDCTYVGLDVAEGKGVDVVCEGQNYDAPDSRFDVVISCEVMEHNPYWYETFRNMVRLCRPGGLVVMTCATNGRPEHGTSRTDPSLSPLTVELAWNYYRNLREKDFRRTVDFSRLFAVHRFWLNWNHYDLLFVGIKGSGLPEVQVPESWTLTTRAIDAWIVRESGLRVHRYRRLIAMIFGDRWFTIANRLSATLNWLHGVR